MPKMGSWRGLQLFHGRLNTSTVVHPSRGQVEGSATRLPAPAAPAGWRFAKSPPSRAGAIAASTQIACNSTKSYVKWV